jgi:uncharacterized protein (DUF1778 family)
MEAKIMTMPHVHSSDDSTARQVQFNIRMSTKEKQRIEDAARVSRQTITEFTQNALAEKADEILAHHEQIVLSNRDYNQFVAIMTADTEPTEIAKREAAGFKTGKVEGAR